MLVSQNSCRVVICCMDMLVLCGSVGSCCSLFLTICMDGATGTDVKRVDITGGDDLPWFQPFAL